MDKKISIRLREKEYGEIAEYAETERKSISEYIRSRVLKKLGQEEVTAKENVRIKMQLLVIKQHMDRLSRSCPNINFQPVEDALEHSGDMSRVFKKRF